MIRLAYKHNHGVLKMKMIRPTGMVGSYATFDIEDGDNSESIGDQVWFSPCGTKMEICEHVSRDTLDRTARLFSNRMAFIGAFRKVTEQGAIK